MRTVKEALEDGSLSLEDEIDYADMTEEDYKKEIERLTKQNKALNEMYELTKKKEYIRLNNIIKQQDTRNSRQRIANRELLERNQDLVIENLKSNNIINELEKWIKEILLSKAYSIGYKEAYKDIYMKLQELKGSESNE